MPLAYIALGSNLPSSVGDPCSTLNEAIARLGQLGLLLSRSSFYRTAPVGYPNQPDFLNAVVALQTTLPPLPLMQALADIELQLGRDRSNAIPNGPRTLDLDMLLYDNLVLDSPTLQLPHPRMTARIFVLEPLAEIAPDLIPPGTTQTVAQLLQLLLTAH